MNEERMTQLATAMARMSPRERQQQLDALAAATSMTPIAGDIAGGVADAHSMITDKSARTPGNAGLAALGLLPGVPSLGTVKRVTDAEEFIRRRAGKLEEAATNTAQRDGQALHDMSAATLTRLGIPVPKSPAEVTLALEDLATDPSMLRRLYFQKKLNTSPEKAREIIEQTFAKQRAILENSKAPGLYDEASRITQHYMDNQ